MTDLVILDPMLNYELLLDGSLTSPAFDVGVLLQSNIDLMPSAICITEKSFVKWI